MTKTITLTGEETAVKLGRAYPYIWVRNLGASDVYMSLEPNIVPDADGVITVPAGGGASTGDVGQTDTVYFLGDGKIEVSPQFNAVCPFFKPAKGGEITYQYMPVMTGITAFFEPSGIDIANGVWHNSVGENDIILNGGAVENGALKFAAGEYGELSETTEPDVYYILFKKPDVGTNTECLIGKEISSNTTDVARELHIWTDSDGATAVELTKNSSPYVNCEDIDKSKYHIAVISNMSMMNTSYAGVSLFIDSNLIGSITSVNKGNYNKKVIINHSYRGALMSWSPKTDTYVKMIAIGAEQSARDIIKNSEYLVKKFI